MLQDYAVRQPRGGFPRQAPQDDEGLRGERLTARVLARQQERRELHALLGAPVYARTTILPLVGGGYAGPARDRFGRELRWGLWSPHRQVLIDVFPRVLPPTEELEDRAAWAKQHGYRYALVRPGMRLTGETLRGWLAREGVSV